MLTLSFGVLPSFPHHLLNLQQDESLLSSDLSTDLSDHKEQMPLLSFPEDEESVDEEELPSFLMQTSKICATVWTINNCIVYLENLMSSRTTVYHRGSFCVVQI